jgi:transposase-like protein
VQRSAEPLPAGKLTYPHYCAIHRHLFQDVYTWAGKPRTVRIAKGGSMFCYPAGRYYTLTYPNRSYTFVSPREIIMKSVVSATHFHDEGAAYKFVEARLWPNGPVCPHCGGVERISKMGGKSTRVGAYKCYQCRKPFTVKVGTIFEASQSRPHASLATGDLLDDLPARSASAAISFTAPLALPLRPLGSSPIASERPCASTTA